MTVPVIEAKTSVTTNSVATNRDIDLPTGTASGDLILIFGNVESVAGNWNTPTGDTFTEVFAPFTADSCIIGAWYRIADGGEPATFNCSITSATGENMVLSCWRVSGVDTTTPINVVGTPAGSGGNATSHVIGEVTTDENDCLAVAFLGFDGGDGSPFSTSGTGWAEEDDLTQDAADGGRQSMSISIKSQTTAGATGDCTVTSTVSDGSAKVQFAIAPAAANNTNVNMDAGAFTLTGQSADITSSGQVNMDLGNFTLTGNAATLSFFTDVMPERGLFTFSGHPASVSINQVTSLPVWPASLPQAPLLGTVKTREDDVWAFYDSAVGADTIRARSVYAGVNMGMTFRMTKAQYSTLMTFWSTTLNQGAGEFTMPDPLRGGTATFTFVDAPRIGFQTTRFLPVDISVRAES